MCGIIGYKGNRDVRDIVITGLKRLEYRGYDSWGIAEVTQGEIKILKRVGKIGEFNETSVLPIANTGIGHTRWATHGEVSERNAHPQLSCNGNVAIVHNGIIENHVELKKRLEANGHNFKSDTDSEVIAHLIEEEMKGKGFKDAFLSAINQLKGSFAVVAVTSDGDIAGARMYSPLVVGLGDGEIFISSDVIAFLGYTNKAVYLDDGEAVFYNGKPEFTDFSGNPIKKDFSLISEEYSETKKGSYPHYMLKEIEEQPQTIMNIANYPKEKVEKAVEIINSAYGVFFVAAGSSYHAALAASYVFSKIAKKHINVVLASEFPYYKDFLTNRTLVIPISQSGETADVLEAIRTAKKKRAKILSLVNNTHSTLARMSDWVLEIMAGIEIGVAATKSFTNQLALLVLFAYASIGKEAEGRELLSRTSNSIREVVSEKEKVRKLANRIASVNNVYVIGRGSNYPIALEGALKIKEVSYIHAEGFSGGEIKHGTIALIDPGTPVVVLAPDDETKDDIISNAMELKSRGAFLIGLSGEEELFDIAISVSYLGEFTPIIETVILQYLAYYLAVSRGIDPDKPRNLAKSVTVK